MLNDDREEQEERKEIKLAIVGDVSCGKTTLILALRQYARQFLEPDGSPWIFEGADDDTDIWLRDRKGVLSEGSFPVPTESPKTLRLLLHNKGFAVRFVTEERAGGDLVDLESHEDMIEYLADCDGIVFLISPTVDKNTCTSELIEKLYKKIDFYLHGTASGQPLRQFVSVCLSLYDDDRFFQWLKSQPGFLQPVNRENLKNVPIIPSQKVPEVFLQWENFPDGEDILGEFRTRFEPKNVKFFAISSIGFYFNPKTKSINWRDCNNAPIGQDGKSHIRNAPNFRPIALFDPLAWLIKRIKENRIELARNHAANPR